MRRTRPILLTALLAAILLVCFLTPNTALAASKLGNDNHTDTDDYCLRAHDVKIGLSEFSAKSRSELESDIIQASDFAFLIRDSANETGTFVPISSGYTVDFSNLEETVSTSGYVITVSLPAITLASPSNITFRVFVEDDLPKPCLVRYRFESATPDRLLPDGVLSLLPAEDSSFSGETVTPATDFSAVRDGAGIWTFSGWTPQSAQLTGTEFTFSGLWSYTALPLHTVTYHFVSKTDGMSLPDGVLKKLPTAQTGVDGDVFTPSSSFPAYHMQDGAWRFRGWTIASQTIAGGDLTFTGEWRWYKDRTPTPTPAPTASPSAAPSPTPILPTPSATQTQSPAMMQTLNDSNPPLASGTTGGTAQMAIATVLTALIGAQAFAIVSDLKVLKWYNAKKAARRTNG